MSVAISPDSDRALITVRTAEPAFHPNADQQVLDLHAGCFCLLRTAPTDGHAVLCIHNVTARAQRVSVHPPTFGFAPQQPLTDLLTGQQYGIAANDLLTLTVAPYGVAWLR